MKDPTLWGLFQTLFFLTMQDIIGKISSPQCKIYSFKDPSQWGTFFHFRIVKKLTLWGISYPTLWGIPKENLLQQNSDTPRCGDFFFAKISFPTTLAIRVYENSMEIPLRNTKALVQYQQ